MTYVYSSRTIHALLHNGENEKKNNALIPFCWYCSKYIINYMYIYVHQHTQPVASAGLVFMSGVGMGEGV